jgi:hypothetical protein
MATTGTVESALRICVIIPAYNEGESVQDVVHAVQHSLPKARTVVVDDGSTDDTSARAIQAGATVITLPVNLGIGGAVQTGYRYALRERFDICLQIDGDGQHDPEEAPLLIAPLVHGDADLVVGSRWLGRGDYIASPSRRMGMKILARLVRWKTGAVVTDPTSGFRAVSSKGISLYAANYPADYPEVEALLLATNDGLRIMEIPVRMHSRQYGMSSISGLGSAYYMARVSLSVILDRPSRRQ